MPNWLTITVSILGALISVGTLAWRIKVDNRNFRAAQQAEQNTFTANVTQTLADLSTRFAKQLESIQQTCNKQISEQQKEHTKEITDLRLEMKDALACQYKEIDERRRKDVKDLHDRMDNFETSYLSTVTDRLGKIEGNLENMSDVLLLIQRHFIENQQ